MSQRLQSLGIKLPVITSFYDTNLIRYRLVKEISGDTHSPNWLFLPGGPGADASYFIPLINSLDMPGKYWLMDFPANGDNFPENIGHDYDFNLWETYFVAAIKQFENPILVGQSFGGMFPLLFPELESILKGLVIISSAPKLWLTDAADYAKEHNVSTTNAAGEAFRNNPSAATFRAALQANVHCSFPMKSLSVGKKLFEEMPFNYAATLWWLNKVQASNLDALWIPQAVPTMIIGGKKDFITPCRIFENDERFQRDNIRIHSLSNAGHFPWVDEPEVIAQLFRDFRF